MEGDSDVYFSAQTAIGSGINMTTDEVGTFYWMHVELSVGTYPSCDTFLSIAQEYP